MKFNINTDLQAYLGHGEYNHLAVWFYNTLSHYQELCNNIQPGSDVDITMSINGVVIDPRLFFERMQTSYNDEVKKSTKAFMKEHMSAKLFNFACEIERMEWVFEDYDHRDVLAKDARIKELEAELTKLRESTTDRHT